MVFKDLYTILNHFLTKNHENGSDSTKIDAAWCGSIPGPKINIFKVENGQKNKKMNKKSHFIFEGWG